MKQIFYETNSTNMNGLQVGDRVWHIMLLCHIYAVIAATVRTNSFYQFIQENQKIGLGP